jgi:hypothetical protein
VGASGAFELRLATGAAPAAQLVVDAVDPSRRRYIPALANLDSLALAEGLGIVLVPLEWEIPGGTFGGRIVGISVDDAYTPACPGCPSFYRQGVPSALRGGAVNPESWRSSAFPIPVAFDREHSRSPITARDSVDFWDTVREMELAFGEPLFRPATHEETIPRDGEDLGEVILVTIEPTLPAMGYGSSVSAEGTIFYGAVRLRRTALLRSPEGRRIVVHELMHALGLGHTCLWRSVMAQVPVCTRASSPTLTAQDVAYTQVLARVRHLQRTHGARAGIEAALAGERMFLKGY